MIHFRINSPNVIYEIIDGEAVMVNLESGSYYSIDKVGIVVWEYVDRGMSNDQIVSAISAQYDGERTYIERHVDQLLDQLQAEELIVLTEASPLEVALPSENADANGGVGLEFEAPVLHKYTDMEDLLLLDPIHEVDETGWPNTGSDNAAESEVTSSN